MMMWAKLNLDILPSNKIQQKKQKHGAAKG